MALTYATLGPDLYGGTGGVAVFLAELAAVTGDELFRRTAIGAIAHALARAPELAANLDRSLYSGRVGIAVAAAAVGAAVGKTQYLEAAAQIAAGTPLPMARGEFDIISGRAGSIYGLLWLSSKLGEAHFGEEAPRLAWELAEAAERSGGLRPRRIMGGRAPNGRRQPHRVLARRLRRRLCATRSGGGHRTGGTCHGRGAGVSPTNAPFSMLECGTGPIYGPIPERSTGSPGPPSYPVAWCHGAAGIALARLRAYELTGLPVLKHEAEVALETTFVHTKAVLRAGAGSYSLCHGLAGNAEILEKGYRILGSSRTKWHDLALEVASSGIERFGRPGQTWPCGTYEGETPSLMLGLAGAGLFYLRLYEPTIGSALLLLP